MMAASQYSLINKSDNFKFIVLLTRKLYNVDMKIKKSEFVEVSGKIIIEPQYTNARSFANGYAAVCNENNLWGFLNDEHKLCIDYTYKDALYFNSNETCLVSTTENTVQLLHFMFE